MNEKKSTYIDQLAFGSKFINLKIRPDGVAIVSISSDESLERKVNETTILYHKIAEQLQRFANQEKRVIEQRFSTRNEKMKSWMNTKGVELGFIDLNDDGRVLRAKKIYHPTS